MTTSSSPSSRPAMRSGATRRRPHDTPASRRKAILAGPPNLLLTTPESLESMLVGVSVDQPPIYFGAAARPAGPLIASMTQLGSRLGVRGRRIAVTCGFAACGE